MGLLFVPLSFSPSLSPIKDWGGDSPKGVRRRLHSFVLLSQSLVPPPSPPLKGKEEAFSAFSPSLSPIKDWGENSPKGVRRRLCPPPQSKIGAFLSLRPPLVGSFLLTFLPFLLCKKVSKKVSKKYASLYATLLLQSKAKGTNQSKKEAKPPPYPFRKVLHLFRLCRPQSLIGSFLFLRTPLVGSFLQSKKGAEQKRGREKDEEEKKPEEYSPSVDKDGENEEGEDHSLDLQNTNEKQGDRRTKSIGQTQTRRGHKGAVLI